VIPDRAPTSIWCLNLRNLGTYVRTAPDDRIVVVADHEYDQQYLDLSRKDARLLAKRINECLDATVKR
jgi:glycine/D-amino acid oxidase-like deaminating enzyme